MFCYIYSQAPPTFKTVQSDLTLRQNNMYVFKTSVSVTACVFQLNNDIKQLKCKMYRYKKLCHRHNNISSYCLFKKACYTEFWACLDAILIS